MRARLACRFAPVLLALSLAPGCKDEGADDEGAGSEGTGAASTDAAATGEPTSGGDEAGSTLGPADDPVWDTPYCYMVADGKWISGWISFEDEVLALVNAARAKGGDCGSQGAFAPTDPLTTEPRLRCAARKHSQDMAERNYFDHVNPEGESPYDRMAKAGYTSYQAAGENIAAGSMTPAEVVQGWLDSDGHCANMLSPNFTQLGVGFYEGAGDYTYYWTQDFATPFQ